MLIILAGCLLAVLFFVNMFRKKTFSTSSYFKKEGLKNFKSICKAMEALNLISHHMVRRSKAVDGKEDNVNGSKDTTNIKRSAENSPEKGSKKRSILTDITNKSNQVNNNKNAAKVNRKTSTKKSSSVSNENSKKHELEERSVLEKEIQIKEEPVDSVYVTAFEDSSQLKDTEDDSLSSSDDSTSALNDNISKHIVPPGVEDFDKATLNDPFSESIYAASVFEYYRRREEEFPVKKYMDRQPEVTKAMRAVLVDWMVEVQESFELNHETLYLAAKLVDHFLMHHTITKASLQLVGATAILIASKYDERIPPLVDDILYICDDSYSHAELISMEMKILRTMDFQLGLPLSYRFLRRYARCSRISMETLTLARYILETSLMDYDLIEESDSKMAAAALLLALKMKNLGQWTSTLQYYSKYEEKELHGLMKLLNKGISGPPNKNLQTVRTKYSHKIFFEVAKISPLKFEE